MNPYESNWDSLPQEEKMKWDNIANDPNVQKWAKMILTLMNQKNKCWMCRYEFESNIFDHDGLHGNILAHMQMTHGCRPSDTINAINQVMRNS